jgi:hypothetical protein
MADVLVDLGYRGLSIAKRARLVEQRPSSGYVELAAPLPVGTAIAIATDDGLSFDAIVTQVREVASGERQPGMLLQPKLEGAAAAWWKERVTLPELDKPPPAVALATVVPKKKRDDAAPELIDDGRNTAVTEIPTEAIVELETRDSHPILHDDGKQTTMMDAVDLEALGLSSSSGSLPVAPATEDDGTPAKPKKKRKRRATTNSGA